MIWALWKLIPLGRMLPSSLNVSKLRRPLRFVGKHFFSSGQQDQVEANIDFVTKMISDLSTISRSPKAYKAIQQSFENWDKLYFKAQSIARKQPAFVTYTEEETAIPFHPERDHEYAGVMTTISHIGAELVRNGDQEKIIGGIGVLDNLHALASMTFKEATSCMARYTDHNRISLGIVQRADMPLNCAPSLHVSNYMTLYNLVRVWNDRGQYDVLQQYVREKTLGIISAVLEVKQHTLTDVACGLFAAEFICELMEVDFDDLTDPLMNGMRERYPHIPYDKILDHRDRLRHIKKRDDGTLSGVISSFYKEKRFPRTKPGHYNMILDSSGKLVPYQPKNAA